MDRRTDIRNKALKDLQESEVLMIDGHFDYGNGYHGRVYLNPHQLFRHPSTIWRFAQDLIDVLPSELVQRTEVVAGPATGSALLATIEIYDRQESIHDLGVPNIALAEYKAPDNFKASDCPLCRQSVPITRF